ncbi:MAG: DNA alkylation repair protein [Planctomycetota bacterium]|nr:DNA alkylation repair protein [Planctomycetota bacterium]
MAEPFKNLINDSVALWLGERVGDVWSGFPMKAYRASFEGRLDPLELKARAQLVGTVLRNALPGDTVEALQILTEAIRATPEIGQDDLQSGWPMFSINSLVVDFGVDHPKASLELLYEVTKRFTSEFGIRPFLEHHGESTLATLNTWVEDPNVHVRRLVSEGTRPRLPWAPQIRRFIADPSPILPLLEKLKDDPEEYVRRSVANNLNDICKDHADTMLDVVEAWSQGASAPRQKLIRHACRTLVKAGNPRCLAILGFEPPKLGPVAMELSTATLHLGETLAATTQKLIVDYRFHWIKANGSSAGRVHKGSHVTLTQGQHKSVKHTFAIKPVTTRRYYSGTTRVELVINGEVLGEGAFELRVP